MPAPIYPLSPSVGIRDTSRESAETIAPTVQYLRDITLAVIRERPSTADEIAEATGKSILNIRPRCSELSQPEWNLIRDSGLRRKNSNNRNCIVFEAVPEQSNLF